MLENISEEYQIIGVVVVLAILFLLVVWNHRRNTKKQYNRDKRNFRKNYFKKKKNE
ncbi:MAG: hypothetical protein LAT51_03115 [Flavobacteriaceae bacterium]|nr:hypothetical protein [Flavobacteriaceae bacterium]